MTIDKNLKNINLVYIEVANCENVLQSDKRILMSQPPYWVEW